MLYGEMENVWDRVVDPQNRSLSREDYQQILTVLQTAIAAKGTGKGNMHPTAWPMTQNAWAETLTQIDALADEVTSPPREELHAYLAPGKGNDAGKGKGKAFGKYRTRQLDIEPPIFEELRQRRGEPWNRRGRRATEVSNADYEAWRQGSGSLDRRSHESSHSSMPELLEDPEEETAGNAEPDVEITPDGRTIVHA